jgi:putative flippase GtrA
MLRRPCGLNGIAMNSYFTRLSAGQGLASQGTRYALAGAFVGGVYLLATTFLAVVVGLPFRAALAIGFTLQLGVHFTLQRRFVWRPEQQYALRLRHQARRYVMVAAAQLAVTAASTSLLPHRIGVSAELVYLATVAALTSVNFLLFRSVVFHPGGSRQARSAASRSSDIRKHG